MNARSLVHIRKAFRKGVSSGGWAKHGDVAAIILKRVITKKKPTDGVGRWHGQC